VELLIAMVVLLVGIYTVARGFPLMLYQIRGEGDRTAMTRLCEQAMTRLADNQAGLPDAITGGGSIHPESYPEDVTAPHLVVNALQDTIEVRGEAFRVPAPYRDPAALSLASGPGYHVLGQGPAQCSDWAGGYPYVYMLVPLTEIEDPTAPLDQPNWFSVNKSTGEITVPTSVTTYEGGEAVVWDGSARPGVSHVVVDYAWCAPTGGAPTSAEPVMHYVQGEIPSDETVAGGRLVGTVHPARLASGILLAEGQTRAWARVDFTREAYGVAYPSAPGRYVLDNKYGVRLAFHPADVGLTLKVDYQLRTLMTQEDQDALANGDLVTPRRMLLMAEDVPIESATTRRDASDVPLGEVRLAVKNVDDVPMFTTELDGATALTSAVHMLAVDLQTGNIYHDGNPLALEDASLQPELLQGFENGIVAYPLQISGAPAPYVGHTFRFFYRTLDSHTVQIQKGPRSYVDRETAEAYLAAYLPGGQDEAASLAEVDYRTYWLQHVVAPNDATRRLGVVEFGQWLSGGTWASAESSSGMTVAVNYSTVDPSGARRFVWGELHTVPAGGRKITLNHATDATHPVQVLAVNGASVRAWGFWTNRTGRPQMLSIDTVFLTNPLGSVSRVQ
jgi:hypothetical protein